MHAQDARDPYQGADTGVRRAGLDGLIRGPGHPGGEENALLGAVLPEAGDADAVADGSVFVTEPLVVVGQVRHPTHALPKIIASQPGKPGLI